jgi:cell division initiation protein
MAYAPVELRHVRLRRGLLGYRRTAVDDLIAEVYESFEQAWRERGELGDRVEQLEAELVRQRELEDLLRGTLVSAERVSRDLTDQAHREAELVVAEAHERARAITHEARVECERLERETSRLRGLLRAALETFEPLEPADAGEEQPGVRAA